MNELFVFKLDELLIGLSVAAVGRVVSAVEITPLPGSPSSVLGVIDVGGKVIPVVDLRYRLGLPSRPIELSDGFIIAHTPQRSLVIVADSVQGVCAYNDTQITDPAALAPGAQHLVGIARDDQGIIFIHDLELFLSVHEGVVLDQALTAHQHKVDAANDR
jgi:purine-binding chemotaxis protein CheW